MKATSNIINSCIRDSYKTLPCANVSYLLDAL